MLSKLPLALLAVAPASLGAQSLVAATSALSAPSASGSASGLAASSAYALASRPLSLQLQKGILTVDGFTARMELQQDIHNAGYLTLFIPGTGTIVISLAPLPGSSLIPNAFHGSELSFSAAGRDFCIHSDTPMPESDAYIRVDSSTDELMGQPFLSYGAPSAITNPGPEIASDIRVPVLIYKRGT